MCQRQGQVWEALWGSVEQVQYGAIISSMAGPPALEQSNSGNAEFDTPDNLGCIVDEGGAAQHCHAGARQTRRKDCTLCLVYCPEVSY